VVEDMDGRAILADEVGLGKTVEAGMILKEYMLRGLVRRALVLAPASLTWQWQLELREKFGIPAVRQRGLHDWEGCPVWSRPWTRPSGRLTATRCSGWAATCSSWTKPTG